jgi:multidrug efflux pump subunit AcrB
VKIRGANTVEVGNGLRDAVAELTKQIPADIKLTVMSDRSEWVKRSVDDTQKTILEGALVTVLVVFLFLHSWRSTVITALTLPISVIATFIALYALGFTINALTLMALSLCIGLLIDDAIVVRENIVRHLGMGKDHFTAANEGTTEVGLAVMATTFTIVAVFLPVAFMGGIIGLFFYQFGVTVAVAVLVSLFVSFTLDPMLSSIWHDPVESRFRGVPWLGAVMRRFENGWKAPIASTDAGWAGR